MKKYLFVLMICCYSLYGQTYFEKELKVLQNNPSYKIEELGHNRIVLTLPDSSRRIWNLGQIRTSEKEVSTVPRLTFFWWLDTALTKNRYNFWQEVPITFWYPKSVMGDVNNNNRIEMYGWEKGYYSPKSPIWCYEQDSEGIFQPIYEYPENSLAHYNIYDVDRDGMEELHLIATHYDSGWGGYVHDQTFYKKSYDTSLAKDFFFDYNIYRGTGQYIQLNDFTFGDFDKDDTTDAVFFNFAPQQIRVVKYNPAEPTFDSVLAYPTTYDSTGDVEFVEGFVVGDFDMDNKTDLIYSSEYGNIYVLENEGPDIYKINWKGNSGIWNSYINFQTHDIDKNGKPEFWIGGLDFVYGFSRLVCYESDGDNSYHPVIELEFPEVVSFSNKSRMGIDVDNDGVDEIMISIGNIVIILKFTGKPDDLKYEVYYSQSFNKQVNSVLLKKFPNIVYPELVLCMFDNQGQHYREFTQVFSPLELINEVPDEKNKSLYFDLAYNYPNPFNPSTKIKFNIGRGAFVNLTVSNSLGERVAELKNEVMPPGSYEVEFNASNLPSGVYFYTLKAGEYVNTKKMILVK